MEEQAARRRVRRLRAFYIHVSTYAVVLGGIALINWVVSPTFWWVVFPAIGWGIGLAIHGLSVSLEDSLLGADWEEHKTRELMSREHR
jgi:hypothetical protein